MSDEQLRALERRWAQPGATEELTALLRERLRTGRLTRGRLHLAALLGEPAARALHVPPSEASLARALARDRLHGLDRLVGAAWDRALAEAATPAVAALLAAARAHPLLGRLFTSPYWPKPPFHTSFEYSTKTFRPGFIRSRISVASLRTKSSLALCGMQIQGCFPSSFDRSSMTS